ncbi:hypothetical protein G6F24_018290 [Rhizopus arrhizus]|nr:hypothetical protein G6F24_018290 [Rhizopus arrhizus]
MVQVHLHLQVGRIDGLHYRMRVVLEVQDIAGDVARIDGFDQHRDARRTGLARGPVQVLAVAIQQGLARHVGRRQARHHVDIRAGQRRRVGQRLFAPRLDFCLPAGQGGQPALALADHAGRRDEQP